LIFRIHPAGIKVNLTNDQLPWMILLQFAYKYYSHNQELFHERKNKVLEQAGGHQQQHDDDDDCFI